jgi:hypothetical protein
VNKCLDGGLSALWFDDTGDKPSSEFQVEWQELLRTYNLFQFVPHFACFTRKMMNKGGISNLIEALLHPKDQGEKSEQKIPQEALSADQIEELELLDPTLQTLLVPLLKQGSLPWPEFGYEGTSSSGQCGTSILEVAWPGVKVGIALPENDADQFENQNWTIFPGATVSAEPLLKAISIAS